MKRLLAFRRALLKAQRTLAETIVFLAEYAEKEIMGEQIAMWVLKFLGVAIEAGLDAIANKDPAKMRKVTDVFKAGHTLESELVGLEERAKRIAEHKP